MHEAKSWLQIFSAQFYQIIIRLQLTNSSLFTDWGLTSMLFSFFLPFFPLFLFSRLISEKPPGSYWVEVSVVEVYNNEIFDLLAKDSCGKVFGVKRDVVTTREGKSDVPLLTHE